MRFGCGYGLNNRVITRDFKCCSSSLSDARVLYCVAPAMGHNKASQWIALLFVRVLRFNLSPYFLFLHRKHILNQIWGCLRSSMLLKGWNLLQRWGIHWFTMIIWEVKIEWPSDFMVLSCSVLFQLLWVSFFWFILSQQKAVVTFIMNFYVFFISYTWSCFHLSIL